MSEQKRAEKFTAGEWVAGKNKHLTLLLDGYEGKAVYDKKGNFVAFANACNKTGSVDVENAVRIANLIASAPDMYEALNHVCSEICNKRMMWDEAHGYLPAGITDFGVCPCKECPIEKAMKKARGEE